MITCENEDKNDCVLTHTHMRALLLVHTGALRGWGLCNAADDVK